MHDTSFDTIPYTLNISGRLSFFLVIEYNIMIPCKCPSHCRLVSLERIFLSQNIIFVKLFDPICIDDEITLLDIWTAICNILTSDSISIWSTFLGLFRGFMKFNNCVFSSRVQSRWLTGIKIDGPSLGLSESLVEDDSEGLFEPMWTVTSQSKPFNYM